MQCVLLNSVERPNTVKTTCVRHVILCVAASRHYGMACKFACASWFGADSYVIPPAATSSGLVRSASHNNSSQPQQ